MRRTLENVWRLGVKELYSLRFDATLIFLMLYSFTYAIYMPAKNSPTGVKDASIAVVDEDRSALSRRITAGFLPPYFKAPAILSVQDIDRELDASHYTLVVDLPPNLEADLLRSRRPTVQVIADATAMTQAGLGVGYVKEIVAQEVQAYLGAVRESASPITLVTRVKFNSNLDAAPFSAIVGLVNNITLLSLFLSGAAIIREREHGTIEHLLVMPLTPLEIMLAKVCANGLVIVSGSVLSLYLVVEGALGLDVAGSVPLFVAGGALYVLALTSLGIFLGAVGRSMPQFALMAFPVFIIMNLLSGGQTPLESMPVPLQLLMQVSPSTHFVAIAQAILFRGAGFQAVWREFVAIAVIGALFFAASLWRFRRALIS